MSKLHGALEKLVSPVAIEQSCPKVEFPRLAPSCSAIATGVERHLHGFCIAIVFLTSSRFDLGARV